jgi:hypothetical protein
MLKNALSSKLVSSGNYRYSLGESIEFSYL